MGLAKEKWAGMGGDSLSTMSEAADRLSAAAEMESEDMDILPMLVSHFAVWLNPSL